MRNEWKLIFCVGDLLLNVDLELVQVQVKLNLKSDLILNQEYHYRLRTNS